MRRQHNLHVLLWAISGILVLATFALTPLVHCPNGCWGFMEVDLGELWQRELPPELQFQVWVWTHRGCPRCGKRGRISLLDRFLRGNRFR